MKNVIFSVGLIALQCIAAHSEAACLQYNQDGIKLIGRIELRTFFGPPNYGENPDTDSRETQALLVLDKPVCVQADTKTFEDAENDQTEVTLVPVGKVAFSQFDKRHVEVVGSLFHAISGHHHTPVLISVTLPPKLVE